MPGRTALLPGLLLAGGALAAALIAETPETLEPSPRTVDFGEVYLGTSASAPVAWMHRGTEPVRITDASVSRNPELPFSVAAPLPEQELLPRTTTGPLVIAFSPRRLGRHQGTASLRLSEDSRQAAAGSAELIGIGVAQRRKGALRLDGGDLAPGHPLDFGAAAVIGGMPVERRLDLVNDGAEAIRVAVAWHAGNRGFSLIAPSHPIVVRAGRRERITLQFVPAGREVFTDAVTFSDDSDRNLAGTALVGLGLGALGQKSEAPPRTAKAN